MIAGRLNQRVTIQKRTVSQNDYGEAVETWAAPGDGEPAVMWGEVKPVLTGTREAFAAAAGQYQARVTLQVRMRWRTLDPADYRLIVGGSTLEIQAVMDPDGRQRELLALCYEVQS